MFKLQVMCGSCELGFKENLCLCMKIDQKQIDKLVREAQKGNTKAFGEIYDIYYPKIHKYVFYKVSEDHVDDVVSTIFIKSWSKLNKYRKQKCAFSAWLFRIAHNTIVDHYRTNKEFYELEERIADDNQAMNPERLTDISLTGKRVHRALRDLGEKYQEVILLKYMNEMSNPNIANVMKVSESNVRTLQHRALKQLRSIIEDEDRAIERRLAIAAGDRKPGLLRRLFAKS
jgi:RNA polymerase sigma-70 factor (ECF subfamily)